MKKYILIIFLFIFNTGLVYSEMKEIQILGIEKGVNPNYTKPLTYTDLSDDGIRYNIRFSNGNGYIQKDYDGRYMMIFGDNKKCFFEGTPIISGNTINSATVNCIDNTKRYINGTSIKYNEGPDIIMPNKSCLTMEERINFTGKLSSLGLNGVQLANAIQNLPPPCLKINNNIDQKIEEMNQKLKAMEIENKKKLEELNKINQTLTNNKCGLNSIDNGKKQCQCIDGYIWEDLKNLNNLNCVKKKTEDEICKIDFGNNAKSVGNGKCNCIDGYLWSQNGKSCELQIKTNSGSSQTINPSKKELQLQEKVNKWFLNVKNKFDKLNLSDKNKKFDGLKNSLYKYKGKLTGDKKYILDYLILLVDKELGEDDLGLDNLFNGE